MNEVEVCPLCQREMPEGTANDHHLIPKKYKGKDVVKIHRICHDKVHHTFSEHELSNYYHTIDRLLSHKDIQTFVKWVGKQSPYFYDKHKDSKERRRKR